MVVEFEEDKALDSIRRKPSKPKGLTGLFIKKGWVKNKTQASFIFLTIILICIIGIFLINKRTNEKLEQIENVEIPTPEELRLRI